MQIIEISALKNGAHRNQTLHGGALPAGWAVIPDGMELPATFPFVDLAAADGVVTVMTANQTAYDAAGAGNTVHEPTDGERIAALEEALAQTDEAAIELFEANEEQQEINAAQDEALIEIYEMIGG